MQIIKKGVKLKDINTSIVFIGRYKGHGRNILGVSNQLMRNKLNTTNLVNMVVGQSTKPDTTRKRPTSKGRSGKKK